MHGLAPEDLRFGNPNQLHCRDCMRVEAHAQLSGRGSLDYPRYDPQRIFDPTRGRLSPRSIAGWRAVRQPFTILSSAKIETILGMPIEGYRLAIGPVRQLDFFDLCSGPGDGTREPASSSMPGSPLANR